MALFQSWLLRSVARRDSFTDNPVLAVERLNALSRPLQDADKEFLVGAILTLSSSVHLGLSMLQEILPQEKSQERLGEVLCPTLGQLSVSVQRALSSFEQDSSVQNTGTPAPPSADTPDPATPRVPSSGRRGTPSPGQHRPATAGGKPPAPARPWADSSASSPRGTTQPRPAEAMTERFPGLDDGGSTHHLHVEVDIRSGPKTHLVKALQAEMRVQAAIHVAIESLEFAETQLKVVKEVNSLHGGSFDLVQKHFYEGYNRLLFRALELQRRELGFLSPPDNPGSVAPARQQLSGRDSMQASPKQQHSVSFQSTMPSPSPATTPRANDMLRTAYSERRPLGRRNTIQGIKQEDPRNLGRPPLKRRLSLAQELAMVGEDSESGYQDETSEMASSASELEQSDVESSDSRRLTSRGFESEDYSTNGDSAGEESAVDSEDDGDSQDKTLDVLDIVGRDQGDAAATNRLQSRLPRPQQLRSREEPR